MLEQNMQQKRLIQRICFALFCSFLIWFVALMHGATIVRDAPIGSHYNVRVGPFVLNELAKLPLMQGYTIRLGFTNGAIWYIMISLAMSVAIGLLWQRSGSGNNPSDYH